MTRGNIAASGGDPNDWHGTRVPVALEERCGFCLGGDCELCPHEIAWFDKLWLCPCECNAKWVPQKVTVEKKTKVRET